jgi:ABC-type glutathione transport system ATPase component
MTVYDIVKDPCVYNKMASGNEVRETVLDTLKVVGVRRASPTPLPAAFSEGSASVSALPAR